MTYEELSEWCIEKELAFPDRPPQITPEGLFIPGTVDEGALEILIKIEEGGLRAWVRDPEGFQDDDGEPFIGREWSHEAFFENYDDLIHWAYDW